MVFFDMFYDLNSEEDNKMDPITIDWIVYRIGVFSDSLKNEIKDMISKIDDSKETTSQREPIVFRILDERNDLKEIKIKNPGDLANFINFIKFKIKWEI